MPLTHPADVSPCEQAAAAAQDEPPRPAPRRTAPPARPAPPGVPAAAPPRPAGSPSRRARPPRRSPGGGLRPERRTRRPIGTGEGGRKGNRPIGAGGAAPRPPAPAEYPPPRLRNLRLGRSNGHAAGAKAAPGPPLPLLWERPGGGLASLPLRAAPRAEPAAARGRPEPARERRWAPRGSAPSAGGGP